MTKRYKNKTARITKKQSDNNDKIGNDKTIINNE